MRLPHDDAVSADGRAWASAATLEVRAAVRSALDDLAAGDRILVACSGGPDSLALAAAAQFVGARRGLDVGAVIVDHRLQDGSDAVAAAAGDACLAFGLDPIVIAAVDVEGDGGPEAAARRARYDVLGAMATRYEARAVLLGHTRDDQAETVLLRLARGSGTRTLAAMQERGPLLRRPLLHLPRATVQASGVEVAAAVGMAPWLDPHNSDPAFTRVRVRTAMAVLEDALGPGLVTGLARSAQLAHDDADALERWADREFDALVDFTPSGLEVDAEALALLPRAIRSRLLRRMCLDLGSAADAVTFDHIRSLDALVGDWRGQGPVSLPARVSARRDYGRLILTAPHLGPEAGDRIAP